ncbi:hypothetical protein H632_c4217p0, partial [Helicosporidium sp. ATCC 50920]
RCLDHAGEAQRRQLVSRVAAAALELSQDPFGNYVVQYVLDLRDPESSAAVMARLDGHWAGLAVQKFASNVVEKCLKQEDDSLGPARDRCVQEMLRSEQLPALLHDPFANYVVQSALAATSGRLHADLVDAMRPHLATLRGSAHGKRILAKLAGKV